MLQGAQVALRRVSVWFVVAFEFVQQHLTGSLWVIQVISNPFLVLKMAWKCILIYICIDPEKLEIRYIRCFYQELD